LAMGCGWWVLALPPALAGAASFSSSSRLWVATNDLRPTSPPAQPPTKSLSRPAGGSGAAGMGQQSGAEQGSLQVPALAFQNARPQHAAAQTAACCRPPCCCRRIRTGVLLGVIDHKAALLARLLLLNLQSSKAALERQWHGRMSPKRRVHCCTAPAHRRSTARVAPGPCCGQCRSPTGGRRRGQPWPARSPPQPPAQVQTGTGGRSGTWVPVECSAVVCPCRCCLGCLPASKLPLHVIRQLGDARGWSGGRPCQPAVAPAKSRTPVVGSGVGGRPAPPRLQPRRLRPLASCIAF